jgi:hypothetical protein
LGQHKFHFTKLNKIFEDFSKILSTAVKADGIMPKIIPSFLYNKPWAYCGTPELEGWGLKVKGELIVKERG